MSELAQAVQILMERKKAIVESVIEGHETQFGVGLDDSQARQMFVGSDVDADEAAEQAEKIATLAIIGVVMGQVSAVEMAAGMWIDGLMTGCIVKDLMAKNEACSDG